MTDPTDLPICLKHSIKAYVRVSETLKYMDEANKPERTPRIEREGFVYFIRFRDRIKIGFTSDPKRRFRSIPHDEVIALVPGTMLDELKCHAAFSHLRVQGEWFVDDGSIEQFARESAA